jgi:8-oxo-dGTP pyrophosphatase MutT (NUDIX family)
MLPGGRVRRGEDRLNTAMREMRQELGVVGSGWREIGCLTARSRYRRHSRADAYRRHSTYYVEAEVQSSVLRPRAAELADAAWFTVDSLPSDASDALDVPLRNGWLG